MSVGEGGISTAIIVGFGFLWERGGCSDPCCRPRPRRVASQPTPPQGERRSEGPRLGSGRHADPEAAARTWETRERGESWQGVARRGTVGSGFLSSRPASRLCVCSWPLPRALPQAWGPPGGLARRDLLPGRRLPVLRGRSSGRPSPEEGGSEEARPQASSEETSSPGQVGPGPRLLQPQNPATGA